MESINQSMRGSVNPPVLAVLGMSRECLVSSGWNYMVKMSLARDGIVGLGIRWSGYVVKTNLRIPAALGKDRKTL